ncbi:single-stranded DNA-binding protein [Halocella sp. SP3-1]|uniref:single-stranded DNA-binding protein n=1 Tax=Halocella sp. SP3-1 TaxID=2382161 RepID=UPI000F7568AD|nr:single-stranded DNA-binding protein [Halocella sp. SP3-1]AZO96163.1 single-stranded DNA-binding protein [Halocella sp. SP3-1]
MINKVFLSGRICKDPEMTFTSSGKGVTKFTLAVNRSYGDETDFIRIECWNRGKYELAKYVGNDCRKGDLVMIEGELRIDKYNDNYYTKVNADKVIYSKKKNGQSNKSQQNNNQGNNDDGFDDNFDVPF